MFIEEKIDAKKDHGESNQVPMAEARELCKSFDGQQVLNGLNLQVGREENLVLIGKSGAGKSVLFKCLVGLMRPDSGKAWLFGKDISSLNYKDLNRIRLQVGFLFQGAALYDSMTVGENIAFPLRQHNRRIRESEVKDAVQEVLEQVGLPEAVNRMSSELSGGMRKRIGLARTLVTHPEFMLYDEPTTGLDAVTAREISELIRQLQQEKKISSLVITHDMACARIVSDRIAVLKEGSIRAEGTYEQLHASEDDWVKPFFDTSF